MSEELCGANIHDLKQLKTRESKLAAECDRLLIEKRDASQAFDKGVGKLKSVQEQIKQVQVHPLVSEHAQLRYIERVLGVDLDEIKAAILTDQMLATINALGSGKFPMDGGMKAIVRNKTVVTICMPKEER